MVAHWESMWEVIWGAGRISKLKDMVGGEELRLLCREIVLGNGGMVGMVSFCLDLSF